MSPAPLTEAEKSAAQALHRHFAEHDSLGIQSINPDDFASEARAVVAAVRPLIAAEALQKAEFIIDRQADAKHHNVMHGHSKESFEYIEGIGHASDLVARYRQSLSRPTAEETPDA